MFLLSLIKWGTWVINKEENDIYVIRLHELFKIPFHVFKILCIRKFEV